MLADSITQHRLKLRTADFDPLPDDGKHCYLIGWPSKTNVSDTDIRGWQSLTASRNTGLLCTTTPALDLDIINPDAADAVEALVRATLDQQKPGDRILVRSLPPKRLIPFRTDTPFGKITAKLLTTDGTSEKLEFLGDGRQFVAFGIHPSGRAYSWQGGELGQVPRSALPLIDEEGALELIKAATELLITKFGYRRVEVDKGYRRSVAPIQQDPVLVNDLTQALWKLDPCEWRGRREEWLDLMNGCKGAGIDVESFVAWSTSDPVYRDDGGQIRQDWQSLAGVHGGALHAALKERSIRVGQHTPEVPLTSSSAAGRHHNKRVGDRLIGACVAFKRNPTEPNLFSHACLVAEIVHEYRLVPTYYRTPKPYMDLLASAVMETPLWRALGPEGARRSIENGFEHVEQKCRAQGVQR
jgi:hypothetical protein